MLQIDNLVQWQLVDEENNAVFPWFVHSCLDEIKTWDLTGKKILEFGSGRSTRWWRTKAAWVTSIDANTEWIGRTEQDCQDAGLTNGEIIARVVNEGDQSKVEYYTEIPEGERYDIIINDGVLRTEICQKAVDYFTKNGGGILISDNWYQSYIWLSPKALEIMEPYEAKIFEQIDHTENDGINKWKTAIHFIK